jgi:REP element-mobilizing transposase RayT
MEYQKQAHAVYYTKYHVAVSTKYRRKILKGGVGKIKANTGRKRRQKFRFSDQVIGV